MQFKRGSESKQLSYCSTLKKGLNLRSEMCAKLQEFGKLLLSHLSEPRNSGAVASFTRQLHTLLDRTLSGVDAERSSAAKREKAWTDFHRLRCADICRLWKAFLTGELGLTEQNNLLVQTVTQDLFVGEIQSSRQPDIQHSADALSEDEKNALLYACGYVPVALHC